MAGFRPVQSIGGSPYTGKVVAYGVDSGHSTLLAVGDLVRISGQCDANGLQEVDAAAAAGLITGCIVGIAPNISNLEQAGLPALTGGVVYVATDRNMLLETTSTSAVLAGDVGRNAEIVATAATLSGGMAISNMVLNTATFIAATAQMRLEGIKDGVLTAGGTLYVRINESTFDTVGI